jgi:hypothetical protein
MKAIKISLVLATALSFVSVWNTSCQKDITRETQANLPEEMASKKPDNPGFAKNDMVMYWNEKANTVLSSAMRQPDRSRYFAIIEIAVHDALNNISQNISVMLCKMKENNLHPLTPQWQVQHTGRLKD